MGSAPEHLKTQIAPRIAYFPVRNMAVSYIYNGAAVIPGQIMQDYLAFGPHVPFQKGHNFAKQLLLVLYRFHPAII
jgi:hypothetical protein